MIEPRLTKIEAVDDLDITGPKEAVAAPISPSGINSVRLFLRRLKTNPHDAISASRSNARHG